MRKYKQPLGQLQTFTSQECQKGKEEQEIGNLFEK